LQHTRRSSASRGGGGGRINQTFNSSLRWRRR
jgi:hypothetical protein